MSKSIKISEKHGVNPTIPICFFCGEEKKEIVLLGKLPGDTEAPMHMWIPGDYEPCEKCKEKWSHGIPLIEVNDTANFDRQPEIVAGAYPTGRVVVIREEAIKRGFKENVADELLKHRHGLIDRIVFEEIVGKREDSDDNKE